jgi:hypothetical protein
MKQTTLKTHIFETQNQKIILNEIRYQSWRLRIDPK